MSQFLRDQFSRIAPDWVRAAFHRISRTLRPPATQGLVSEGLAAGLHFDVGHGNPTFLNGRIERPVQQSMAEHLKAGQTVYDIGANVGFFTVLAAKLVGPSGMVYAFEPVPENARMVRENASRNAFQHVKVVEKAATDHAGREMLIVTRDAGGGTLESTNERPPDAIREITVELIRVDDLVSAGTLRPPDFIKLDVEGAEMAALRGMQQTLHDHHPVLLFEVDSGDSPSLEQKYTDCATFLGNLGYEVVRLPESYRNIRWLVAHGLARPRQA